MKHKLTFDLFDSEAEAREAMRRMRKRKYTITWADGPKCWVAWYNA